MTGTGDRGQGSGKRDPGARSERYARQIGIPGLGDAGQARIARSRVLVLGAGGLGSPVLTYLAAAGVGAITVIDDDRIALDNLNRQYLFREDDAGALKATVATERVSAFNPHVRLSAFAEPITAELAGRCLERCELGLDCADNYPARAVLAEAAHRAGVAVIHGAVAGLEGTVGVFDSSTGPCFACVTPESARTGAPPAVLGAAVGAVGCLMALEAIRLLAGLGPDRRGQVLLVDLERGSFEWVRAAKRPDCPICGA